MAHISSRKHESRNARRRHDFKGRLTDTYPIVFSSGALILNMTDGNRSWNLILDEAETAALAARFAERASKPA